MTPTMKFMAPVISFRMGHFPCLVWTKDERATSDSTCSDFAFLTSGAIQAKPVDVAAFW